MKTVICPALRGIPGSKKRRAAYIGAFLKKQYPHAACALDFEGSPFRLLVMARLSAQCTDKRVNLVSNELFRLYPDAPSMAGAPLSEIERLVHSCGVYRVKAKNISDMSKILVRDYHGEVPREKEKLLALPGVGEKIANLMLGDVFGEPHIVADTHCIRLANRFGLLKSQNPSVVVRELERIIPRAEQSDFCHRLIALGRETCKAPRPLCDICPFAKETKE